ncbi:hypothetical protein OIO90_003651 [Microbotryomycetes sp. JL221]|nr:hypothetical protein OIO90_003651 [Microbotryomycetes sp. JL221]
MSTTTTTRQLNESVPSTTTTTVSPSLRPPQQTPIVPPPPPRPEPEPSYAVPASRLRRPVGAFKGGLIGFLLGVTLVGTIGYVQLLSDYTQASTQLLETVHELKQSTNNISNQLQRIQTVEHELNQLTSNMGSKKEIKDVRKELQTLFETQHLDQVELRARVWAIEQDIQLILKTANSTIRV